ncbi:sigma-70 family RNA polymerase sigma factor [Thermodesulfobacteriota bacterium B35]
MHRKTSQDQLLSLLLRTAGGDRRAFQDLYEATHHRLTVYLYRLLRDRSRIEDILVETYTEVWRCSTRFRQQSAVMTWMIGIARNIALRDLNRTTYHDPIDDHPELASPGPDHCALDRKEILNRALGHLSAKHREILDLAFYQDLPYREIAGLIGIPENTVKSRVFHAKASLARVLKRMGIRQDDL